MMESSDNATNALYIRPLRKPSVVELPPGVVKPQDLPLDPIKENVKLKRLFDIIGEPNEPRSPTLVCKVGSTILQNPLVSRNHQKEMQVEYGLPGLVQVTQQFTRSQKATDHLSPMNVTKARKNRRQWRTWSPWRKWNRWSPWRRWRAWRWWRAWSQWKPWSERCTFEFCYMCSLQFWIYWIDSL